MARSRAWRRAQQERIISSVEKWMRHEWVGFTCAESPADFRVRAKKRASAPQVCSGLFCCGNLRAWEGPTRLECFPIPIDEVE